MKSYYMLTLKGKFQRCKKALGILEDNVNSSLSQRVYDALNKCMDNKLNESNVEDLKQEILEANKHRGYTNYCPLEEIETILR